MRIWVTGSNGLVGTALTPVLLGSGNSVHSLVRHEHPAPGAIHWDPPSGSLHYDSALGVPDAFVHLAGENIASHRWTAAQKKRIYDSRVQATDLLCKTLLARKIVPRVFASASAVGIYGDRGDETLDEESAPGDGFLAETALGWEAASRQLESAGCRVVHLRFGLIFSGRGGALRKMLPIFRWGLGGRVGSGTQWISWITLFDIVRSIQFVLQNEAVTAAVNVVSPNPVTNADFTRTLVSVLNRPAVIPVPPFAIRSLFGEMGEALLLGSQRVSPERLLELGFNFEHSSLESALRWAILENPSF